MPTVLPKLSQDRATASQDGILHRPRAGALPHLQPRQSGGSTTLPTSLMEVNQLARESGGVQSHGIQLLEDDDVEIQGVIGHAAHPFVFNPLLDCLPENHGNVGPGHHAHGHACQIRGHAEAPHGPASKESSVVPFLCRQLPTTQSTSVCSIDELPHTICTCEDLVSHDGESHHDSDATFTPGPDPKRTRPGCERAQVLMGSSWGDKPSSSTDRQVLSSFDAQDMRRRLRSIRLQTKAAHVVQTVEVLGRVPGHAGSSGDDVTDSCTKSHSESAKMSETSQAGYLDTYRAIREFHLSRLQLRDLAMNQQASSMDTVDVPFADNDEDDYDSSSDEEETPPVQPASFEFIAPPAISRPSNHFRRRIIVQPVRRHEINASVMVLPGMQDSFKDEHEADGPPRRCTGRTDTVTSLEWPMDMGGMGSF